MAKIGLVFLFLLLLSFSCGASLFGQNKYNLSQFGEETGAFVTQPLRWEGNDWLKFGLVGAGTFLAMQADQPIRDAVFRDHQRYYGSTLVEGGRIWGESYMTPALAVSFGLYGWVAGYTPAKKIGFELGEAIMYSAVITQVLSKGIGRARPNQNLGRAAYQPFTYSGEDFHSLPGGHSSAAFVLSTVLSRNLSPGFLKVLVYVPAVITVGARVYQDFHWTSDDLLGAAIGYFVADWVVNQHEQKDNRIDVSSLSPLTIRIIIN
ncbi:MAG TPA: phosphatase PAP2 family protein [Bacteroidota bacterium]|nr:phosphatase PAP2 family protein [Bacteroidota bacterium]